MIREENRGIDNLGKKIWCTSWISTRYQRCSTLPVTGAVVYVIYHKFMTDILYYVNYTSMYKPLIEDKNFLCFLQFIGTRNEQDRRMRAQLYFMMSIEGSIQSQMVSCESFCIVYIVSFLHHYFPGSPSSSK